MEIHNSGNQNFRKYKINEDFIPHNFLLVRVIFEFYNICTGLCQIVPEGFQICIKRLRAVQQKLLLNTDDFGINPKGLHNNRNNKLLEELRGLLKTHINSYPFFLSHYKRNISDTLSSYLHHSVTLAKNISKFKLANPTTEHVKTVIMFTERSLDNFVWDLELSEARHAGNVMNYMSKNWIQMMKLNLWSCERKADFMKKLIQHISISTMILIKLKTGMKILFFLSICSRCV